MRDKDFSNWIAMGVMFFFGMIFASLGIYTLIRSCQDPEMIAAESWFASIMFTVVGLFAIIYTIVFGIRWLKSQYND